MVDGSDVLKDLSGLFKAATLKRDSRRDADTSEYHIYPVVLDYSRCLDIPMTYPLDIKFVITSHVESRRDEHFILARTMRKAFVRGLLASNSLWTSQSGNKDIVTILHDDGSGESTAVFTIDIYCDLNKRFFNNYQNFFNETGIVLRDPIAVMNRSGVPYATCGWIYYDVVRKMVASREFYERKGGVVALATYADNVAKFTKLYVEMNKNKNLAIDKQKELVDLYTDMRKATLKDISGLKNRDSTLFKAIDVLQKLTNIDKLEKQLLVPPAYAECTRLVIKKLMDDILGKYMLKYNTADYYPVIVGGATLTRCIGEVFRKGKNAINLKVKDIDMPMIVRDVRARVLDIDAVAKVRSDFANEIIADPELAEFLMGLGAKHNFIMRLEITELAPSSMLYKFRMAIVTLRFYNVVHRLLHIVNVMDLPIYTPENRMEEMKWDMYDKLTPIKMRDPVPYYVNARQVVYATCGFVKFDTMAMVMIAQTALADKDLTKAQQRMWYYKYIKYLSKYAAMTRKGKAFKAASEQLSTNEMVELPEPMKDNLDAIIAELGKGYDTRKEKWHKTKQSIFQ